MKTPRDILFARHQAASPKLDVIRREVVAQQRVSDVGILAKLWLELVWPCRRIWTGLAVVWVLLVIINLSQRDDSQTIMAKSTPSPGMMMAYRKHEKMLYELLADRSQPAEAALPQKFTPKPRSEISRVIAI